MGRNNRAFHPHELSTTNRHGDHSPYSPLNDLWVKNGVVDFEPVGGKEIKPINPTVYHVPARTTSFKTCTHDEERVPRLEFHDFLTHERPVDPFLQQTSQPGSCPPNAVSWRVSFMATKHQPQSPLGRQHGLLCQVYQNTHNRSPRRKECRESKNLTNLMKNINPHIHKAP